MSRKVRIPLLAALLATGLAAPAWADETPDQQRAEIRKACDSALATLYKAKPAAKSAVSKSAGYGCFSSFGITVLVGGAGGRGLVHDNATGKDIYMNMGQATAGIEVGIKDYREVLIFKDAKTLHDFVENGWEATAGGGASAAADSKGGTAEKGANFSDKITIYPMTKTGLSAGGSIGGRKYWKDKDLN